VSLTARRLRPGCSNESRNDDTSSSSRIRLSDVIGEDPWAEGLPGPPSVGFGFEALDFIADALIRPAAVHLGLDGSGSLMSGKLLSSKRSLHAARRLRPT
jgi:hypothetical protein